MIQKGKRKEKGRARAVYKAYNDLGSFGGAILRCRGLQPLRLDDKQVLLQHHNWQDLRALSHPLRLALLTLAMAMRKLHFWMESRTTHRTNLRLEKIHLMLNKEKKRKKKRSRIPAGFCLRWMRRMKRSSNKNRSHDFLQIHHLAQRLLQRLGWRQKEKERGSLTQKGLTLCGRRS